MISCKSPVVRLVAAPDTMGIKIRGCCTVTKPGGINIYTKDRKSFRKKCSIKTIKNMAKIKQYEIMVTPKGGLPTYVYIGGYNAGHALGNALRMYPNAMVFLKREVK